MLWRHRHTQRTHPPRHIHSSVLRWQRLIRQDIDLSRLGLLRLPLPLSVVCLGKLIPLGQRIFLPWLRSVRVGRHGATAAGRLSHDPVSTRQSAHETDV